MAEGWGEAPIDEKNLEFSWPATSGNTRSTTQSSFQPPPPQQQSQNQFSRYQSPPPPPPSQQQLQPSPLQQQQQQPPPPLQQQQPPPPPLQQQPPPPPLQQQQQPPPPLQQQQQQQSFLPQRPTSIVSPPPTLQQQQPIVPPESFPPVQQTQKQQIPVPQTQQYYQSKSPILSSQPSLPIKTQDDDVFLKNSIEQTAPSYQNNLVVNDHNRNLQKDHMSVYNDDAWDPSYYNVQTSSSTKPLEPSPFKAIDSQPTFASKDLQKDKSPAIQKGFNDATTQTDPDHIDLTIINLMQQKYSFTITLPNNKVIPPSKLSQFIDVFTESQKTSLPYSSSSILPITKINNNVAAATTAPSYSSNINNNLLKDTSQSYLIKFDDNDCQKPPQAIQQPPQKSPQLTNNKYNDNEILDTARKDDLIAQPHQPVQHQKAPSSNFGNDNQRSWTDGNIPQQQQSNWGKGPVATPAVAPVAKSTETWNNGPQKSPLQQQPPNKYNDNDILDTSGKNRDLIAPPHPPIQHQQAPSSNISSNNQRGWIDGNTPQPQQPISQQLPPQTPPVATPAVAPVATGVESWDNEVKEEDWLEKAAKFEQELNIDPKVRIGIDDGRTNSTTANNIPPAVTNSHSNGYGRGGGNREYQGIGNGSGRPNAKALWDQLLRAEKENDLPKFKRIFEEYTTAAPDETFQSIAKDLKSANSNAKLMALDQSHTNNIASMTSRSLVDLQGNHDKKYLVYITFGPPQNVPQEMGKIASSESENNEWLANAGLPKDNRSNSNNNNTYNNNNVPLCYNCNQKGHISKNCPEASRRDNRGGDINNRPPLNQYSSSTYENRNGAGGGGNDYHSKSYESRYSSGSGGNNMMGGGSNNSSSAKKCYKCGSSDHIARNCEDQQSRFGGGSGGGDRGDYQQRRGYNNNNGYGNNNSYGGSGSGGGYGGSSGGGYGGSSGGGYGGSSGGGYGANSGGGYGGSSGGGYGGSSGGGYGGSSGGGYGANSGGGYGGSSGGGYGGSSGGGYGGSSGGGYGANSGGGRQPWGQNNDINNNMRGGEINANANGNEPNLDNVGAWWK